MLFAIGMYLHALVHGQGNWWGHAALNLSYMLRRPMCLLAFVRNKKNRNVRRAGGLCANLKKGGDYAVAWTLLDVWC